MDVDSWIQLGALLVAISSLIWQEQLKEKRLQVKLQIFYVLTEVKEHLSEDEIISRMKHRKLVGKTNESEIRKSLYEMLKDETIRFTRDSKYKPRLRSGEDGEWNISGR